MRNIRGVRRLLMLKPFQPAYFSCACCPGSVPHYIAIIPANKKVRIPQNLPIFKMLAYTQNFHNLLCRLLSPSTMKYGIKLYDCVIDSANKVQKATLICSLINKITWGIQTLQISSCAFCPNHQPTTSLLQPFQQAAL